MVEFYSQIPFSVFFGVWQLVRWNGADHPRMWIGESSFEEADIFSLPFFSLLEGMKEMTLGSKWILSVMFYGWLPHLSVVLVRFSPLLATRCPTQASLDCFSRCQPFLLPYFDVSFFRSDACPVSGLICVFFLCQVRSSICLLFLFLFQTKDSVFNPPAPEKWEVGLCVALFSTSSGLPKIRGW